MHITVGMLLKGILREWCSMDSW